MSAMVHIFSRGELWNDLFKMNRILHLTPNEMSML